MIVLEEIDMNSEPPINNWLPTTFSSESLRCRQWLYDLCRGIEFEAVKPRQLPKSIGCSKNFPGKTSLATKEQVRPSVFCLPLETPGYEMHLSFMV